MLPRRYSKKTSIFVVLLSLLVYYSPIITSFLQSKLQAPLSPTPTPTVTVNSPQLSPLPSQQVVQGTSTETVKVIRVIDGDTIEIEGNKKLRYIGINSPESVDPRRGVQCFGKDASQRNKELVEGKLVTLERDISEIDRYGRLLRYVYLNGVMINKQLVTEGYALASAYPPDIKHQIELKQAENDARSNQRGLWSSCPNF